MIKLKNKINFARRTMEDIDDQPAKSQAERQSKRKEKRTQEVMEKERTNNAQGEAKRKAKRTQEVVEKERTNQRVCKVAQRAGGLSEARLADVRAGRRKNKSTGVYSGDALKNMEIEAGTFLVEPLTGGSDGLGNLGDVSCNHCGALRTDCQGS